MRLRKSIYLNKIDYLNEIATSFQNSDIINMVLLQKLRKKKMYEVNNF